MQIGVHLLLMFLAEGVAFFGCAAAAGVTATALGLDPAVGVAVFFATVILGHRLARAGFRRLVSARCPECGGPSYCRGSRPIRYVCRACGRVHVTRWSERGINTEHEKLR
jgi:hypothetical protein